MHLDPHALREDVAVSPPLLLLLLPPPLQLLLSLLLLQLPDTRLSSSATRPALGRAVGVAPHAAAADAAAAAALSHCERRAAATTLS